MASRTNPDHKARFQIGVECVCSCGWRSAMWLNKGAKSNAAIEWRSHREKCELSQSTGKQGALS